MTCIHTISVSQETGIVSRKIDPSSTLIRRSGFSSQSSRRGSRRYSHRLVVQMMNAQNEK